MNKTLLIACFLAALQINASAQWQRQRQWVPQNNGCVQTVSTPKPVRNQFEDELKQNIRTVKQNAYTAKQFEQQRLVLTKYYQKEVDKADAALMKENERLQIASEKLLWELSRAGITNGCNIRMGNTPDYSDCDIIIYRIAVESSISYTIGSGWNAASYQSSGGGWLQTSGSPY